MRRKLLRLVIALMLPEGRTYEFNIQLAQNFPVASKWQSDVLQTLQGPEVGGQLIVSVGNPAHEEGQPHKTQQIVAAHSV